ncbi:MAG TPA: GGDEF domain-containing protein [Pyrinomonadaceae bacterium]|nr:GGDEF domain-containing protein [Pyrinomonadaceae bacterium]
MDSNTGLAIQFAGIFLVTLLSLFLQKSLKSIALKYWGWAWLCLSLSLLSLMIAFNYPGYGKIFYCFYLFGEYATGYLLIAGCRNYASNIKLTWKNCWLAIPAAVIAFSLPFLSSDLNEYFYIHSFILASFFGMAYLALRPAKKLQRSSLGWRILRIALALLALSFLHYSLIFAMRDMNFDLMLPAGYLTYNSVIDLVLEILLGFGMIIILLERVRGEVEEANQKLKDAHEKLEQIAQVDPLTTAFNRHAFYGFLRERENTISGCVAVFDIDNLKPINDRYGHYAGDMAIRAVVGAIRSIIRAEDLLFRWGGDEFFAIFISMDAEMARERMKELDFLLTNIRIPEVEEEITVGVSAGFANFSGNEELEKAIKTADEAMYQAKQKRRSETIKSVLFPQPQQSSEFNLTV